MTSPQDYYENDNKTDIALPVTFTWNTATDPDGDAVTYRHCVWVLGQLPDSNKCVLTSVEGTGVLGMGRRRALFWASLLFFIICLLLLLVLVSAILAFYLYRTRPKSGTVARTVAELQPGYDYAWKVIAEDGKGGISESETHRFKTK